MIEFVRKGAMPRRVRALFVAWRVFPLLIGILVVAVAGVALPAAIPLPNFSPQGLATPSTLITAWIAALLATHGGFEPAWDLYATGGTRPQLFNLARIVSVAAAGGILCAVTLGNFAMTFAALCAMLGLALLGGAVLGHRSAWIPPTAYLLVLVGAGAVDAVGTPRPWAAPATSQPGPLGSALAAGLLLVGAAAWWHSSAKQVDLHQRE